VNTLVLSGTASIVPSGTRSSCYREPKFGLPFAAQQQSGDSNLANKDSNVVESQRRMWITAAMAGLTGGPVGSSNNQFCKSGSYTALQWFCMQAGRGAP
jgi:hypothetical protein